MAQPERTADGTARRALLFRAAHTRRAPPAAAVRQVVPASDPPSAGTAGGTRDGLTIERVAALPGAPPSASPAGLTRVLDGSARARAVDTVERVADIDGAPFYSLREAVLPAAVCARVLGALRVNERLAPKLAAAPPLPLDAGRWRALAPPPAGAPVAPGRARVVEAGEESLLGLPRSRMTGVLPARAPCRVPLAGPAGARAHPPQSLVAAARRPRGGTRRGSDALRARHRRQDPRRARLPSRPVRLSACSMGSRIPAGRGCLELAGPRGPSGLLSAARAVVRSGALRGARAPLVV